MINGDRLANSTQSNDVAPTNLANNILEWDALGTEHPENGSRGCMSNGMPQEANLIDLAVTDASGIGC